MSNAVIGSIQWSLPEWMIRISHKVTPSLTVTFCTESRKITFSTNLSLWKIAHVSYSDVLANSLKIQNWDIVSVSKSSVIRNVAAVAIQHNWSFKQWIVSHIYATTFCAVITTNDIKHSRYICNYLSVSIHLYGIVIIFWHLVQGYGSCKPRAKSPLVCIIWPIRCINSEGCEMRYVIH